MAQIAITDVADFTKAQLRDLGPMKFQNIATTYQYHEVFNHLFRREKVSAEGGYGVQKTLLHRLSGAARHVGLLDSDNVDLKDVMLQMTVDFRTVNTSWGIVYRMLLMNRDPYKVVDYLQAQRASSLLDMVEEIEGAFWTNPASTDATAPLGLPHWLPKQSAGTTPAFLAALPSGYTTIAGINPSTVEGFRPWAGSYTNISKADLVKKLRTAHRKTGFVNPIRIPSYTGKQEAIDRYRIYTNETGISGIEDLGEGQNENLGRDIASMDGQIVFRGHPIIWVPYLDTDTADPFYGVDFDVFSVYCLTDDYLRESGPIQVPYKHNQFGFFVDLTYAYMMLSRRNCFVLSTA